MTLLEEVQTQIKNLEEQLQTTLTKGFFGSGSNFATREFTKSQTEVLSDQLNTLRNQEFQLRILQNQQESQTDPIPETVFENMANQSEDKDKPTDNTLRNALLLGGALLLLG